MNHQKRKRQGLTGLKVPLDGYQLERERVTGAKQLRLGCDSASARLEHTEEMPALWHVKQSFFGCKGNIETLSLVGSILLI